MNIGRILVVDDDESIRSTLNDYFHGIGYDVLTANDGEDALKKFVPGAFDCIISDLFMPTIDGLELLKRIRLRDSQVLFLMITGFPGIDSALNAMNNGAYDYITKPFHMDDMRLKVERALRAKKTDASLRKLKRLLVSSIILISVLISLGIIVGIFWKGK